MDDRALRLRAADVTPAAAIKTFAEPCCGDGDLVQHLEPFGLVADALGLDHYGACDAIITNPPYTRDLMHRLIVHFQGTAPTWLLLETDWMSTLQAMPYLGHCSDIVTIGRVKWIEDSKHTGKDNHAWYRFDAGHKGVTAIHRRNQGEDIAPLRRAAVCSISRFCFPACKQQAYRKRLISVTSSVTPIPGTLIKRWDSQEVFRYVQYADVPRLVADGWECLPALDGTHHGEYSVLMWRVEQRVE